MAEILPGINVIKCSASESIISFNDLPQSGLTDNITNTEFFTVSN